MRVCLILIVLFGCYCSCSCFLEEGQAKNGLASDVWVMQGHVVSNKTGITSWNEGRNVSQLSEDLLHYETRDSLEKSQTKKLIELLRIIKSGQKKKKQRSLRSVEEKEKKSPRHFPSDDDEEKKKKVIVNITTKNKETVTILGLFELSDENGDRRVKGVSEKVAAALALDDVNNSGMLDSFHLTMHTNDTQCDPGAGVDAFFHALYMKKEVQMICVLGASCSEVTERLAKVVTHWSVLQVSFGSTSPSLSDRKEFPLFFRTVSPVSSHAEAIIQFMRYFQWDTVTFFTQNENIFTLPANYLVTQLEKANISCRATLTFSRNDFKHQLQDMKELDSRIIIANLSPNFGRSIFCEVYRLGMFGSDYAWILIAQPQMHAWWQRRADDSSNLDSFLPLNESTPHPYYDNDCTDNQLEQAVANVILVNRHNALSPNRKSVSGLDMDTFTRRLKSNGVEIASAFAPEAYDAVWTVALALRNMRHKHNHSFESFHYRDQEFSSKFKMEMENLHFQGISGPIAFSGSDRVGITSFMQIQRIGEGNKKEVKVLPVGLYDPEDLNLAWNCTNCVPIQWSDHKYIKSHAQAKSQAPIARRELRLTLDQVDDSLGISVAALGGLGILLAIAFLTFNLYNRKLKYIKLSSPRLNNMVIVGCILAYVAVIFLSPYFTEFPHICTIRVCLLAMGFSLSFGAMFAKTYRVHRIFTRSCIGVVKNKLLRDTQLMSLVMVLLLMDFIIVSSWIFVDPMKSSQLNLTLQMDPHDRSVVYQPQISICQSDHSHVWLSILYGYKSLLLVVGLYMAWETRHVKIPALNDSKYIGLCVYTVVLTSVLGASLANVLWDRVTLSFVCVTCLILFSTSATLCLLFIPKIHAIAKHASGIDPIVESMGLKIECNTRRFLVEEDTKELLFRAEVQNRVFKRQIERLDLEIWKLEQLLTSHDDGKTPGAPGTTLQSSQDESDIFTIYLHAPRFIFPISMYTFLKGNNQDTLDTAVLSPSSVAVSLPRSSWPNTTTSHTLSLPPKNTRFQSEPRLLVSHPETMYNDFHQEPKTNELPVVKLQSQSATPLLADPNLLSSQCSKGVKFNSFPELWTPGTGIWSCTMSPYYCPCPCHFKQVKEYSGSQRNQESSPWLLETTAAATTFHSESSESSRSLPVDRIVARFHLATSTSTCFVGYIYKHAKGSVRYFNSKCTCLLEACPPPQILFFKSHIKS